MIPLLRPDTRPENKASKSVCRPVEYIDDRQSACAGEAPYP